MSDTISLQGIIFHEGDVLSSPAKDGVAVSKILRIDDLGKDKNGKQQYIFHSSMWLGFKNTPTLEQVRLQSPFVQHVPIGRNEDSPLNGMTVLGNLTVEKSDLDGFLYYLKTTNFKRYLQETGQNLQEVLKKVQEKFNEASRAGDLKDHKKAIDLYSEVVDLFPPYYEAIDNRAFERMNLGQFNEAIQDFQESLRINPKGFTATFSIGDCYMRLGKIQEAFDWVKKSQAIDPKNPVAPKYLAALKNKLPKAVKKPWWKVW